MARKDQAAKAAAKKAADAATAARNASGVNNPTGASTPPAAPTVQTKKSGKTCTVGCKIPSGLKLQLFREVDWIEETRSGSIPRKRWDRFGEAVIVRGPAVPVGSAPKGYKRPAAIVGGYGLTPNVDAEFMREWMKQNAKNPIVVNGMIFVQEDNASAVDEAKDMKDTRSGLEPVNPDDDPRIPKSVDPNVGSIETADQFSGTFMPEGGGEEAEAMAEAI